MGDSEQVARYYATKRGVPTSNLLGLTITVPSYYYYLNEYGKFYAEMVAPIKNKLAALGSSNIDIILLAGQLPTLAYDGTNKSFAVDNALMGLNSLGSASTSAVTRGANPYFEPNPTFYGDLGHFDHSLFRYNGTEMYLVTRLGSNSNLRALEQIDQSVYADRYLYAQPGYYHGNVYIDSRSGIPYPQLNAGARYSHEYLNTQVAVFYGTYAPAADADMNIAYAENYVLASGLPLKWENTTNGLVIGAPGASFSDGTPAQAAPRALYYGGWYNYNKYNDVYEWLPGSFACDVNSGSYFAIEALKRGATGACFVLVDPGAVGHPRPNVVLYYLLNGYSFAEASALATPYILYGSIIEGDPLYAPMQPKAPVPDTQFPILSAGYPKLVVNTATGNGTLTVLVEDVPEPEVVTVRVEYGADLNYGTSVTSAPGFRRHHKVTLPWTLGGTYHYRVILTDPVGNVTSTGDYLYVSPVAPPTVVTPASANPNPVTATTTNLTVLGGGQTAEAQLTYTWSATGPAAVTFSINGTNAAKNSTATFSRAGSYTMTAAIRNPDGGVTTSNVGVTVQQTATSVAVSPTPTSVVVGGTKQFAASVKDQFSNTISPAAVTWAVTGGGTISASGLFTAGNEPGGPFTVNATSGSVSGTAAVTVTLAPPPPEPLLHIRGEQSETSGLLNGAVVTPTRAPAGFTGLVVANGTGSVNFGPAQTGTGVYFANCCSNTNRAYYKFSGATIGSIFDVQQGQISFYLKSRYSFAQRKVSAVSPRYAFDVRDGNGQHMFYFRSEVTSGRLQFTYAIGGAAQYYYVPQGTEESLFGAGSVLKVTLGWDSAGVRFYLNEALVKTTPYTASAPNWTQTSVLALGAYEYQTAGGYYVSDDIIDEFIIMPVQ